MTVCVLINGTQVFSVCCTHQVEVLWHTIQPFVCLFDRSFSLELLVEIFYFAKRTQNEVFLKFYEKSRRMILLIFCLRLR